MDKLARLSRLRGLVAEAGGTIDGRKKLHKLAYLCQYAGTDLGQSFVFHMYGVYSPSLAEDLKAAESWNMLVETGSGDDGYEIKLGDEQIEESPIRTRIDDRGFAVVKPLASQTASTLEVVSTIVYLYDTGYRGQHLKTKLKELKGHLDFVFTSAYKLASQHFGVGLAS